MKRYAFSLVLVWAVFCTANAQEEDLLALLGEETTPTREYVTASFKTNRVVNGHSIENTHAGVLDFKISHRFGPVRGGLYDVFGLDGANIRLGLDFGITDRLMVGVARNSREKMLEGFAKYKILWQSEGSERMPISLSYLVDAQLITAKFQDNTRQNYFSSRLFYTHQLLIARKFSDAFTMQLMPTVVHRNLVSTATEKNDIFALGFAARQKLNKRVTLNAEYYWVPGEQLAAPFTNNLSVGFDIETGGHVFQLHFTNSADMTYKGFITETNEKWFFKDDSGKTVAGFRFGFNISRVFTVIKPKGI